MVAEPEKLSTPHLAVLTPLPGQRLRKAPLPLHRRKKMKFSESLGKTDAAELELREGMNKALEMAYPISEQEAAETVRQMEEAEREHELEL